MLKGLILMGILFISLLLKSKFTLFIGCRKGVNLLRISKELHLNSRNLRPGNGLILGSSKGACIRGCRRN